MGDDDVPVVKLFYELHELVDVHMSAGVRPVGVLVDVEGALGNEDFAFGDVI
jgi:hypothetical protein